MSTNADIAVIEVALENLATHGLSVMCVIIDDTGTKMSICSKGFRDMSSLFEKCETNEDKNQSNIHYNTERRIVTSIVKFSQKNPAGKHHFN